MSRKRAARRNQATRNDWSHWDQERARMEGWELIWDEDLIKFALILPSHRHSSHDELMAWLERRATKKGFHARAFRAVMVANLTGNENYVRAT